MKNKLLITGMLLFSLLISSSIFAQDWVSKMQDPNVNFFEVQKTFNKYYKQKDKEIERQKKRALKKKGEAMSELDEMEVPGYFQYKRWEWFMAPRVYANGQRFNASTTWTEMEKYKGQNGTFAAGNWTLIGPTNSIPSNGGAGRLNFVRLDPTNANTIFVGSPAGGLWKSTDGGNTWSTNTDQLNHVIGCTDIAIDPTNTNVMYLATGDGDAGDTYTVGLLKTTDGGVTWNTTGLSFSMANYRQMSKVLIDPSNTNNILVATSGGIFRSTDAGLTFTTAQTGSFKDMEFKSGDPLTVYACGGEFYKSVNGGQTWSKITSGLPVVTNVSRMAIATSAANPDYVYMIVGLAAPNYGTEGFYKSTNNGTSFSKISTPALGTQQWYDLAIAVSPNNQNEIILGGQTDFLRSTNGGTSWVQNGGTTHVDYHDIVFTGPTTYFMANDGGIYKTTNSGSSWTNLSDGLQIAQMYGFGQSTTNANLTIQGWQDNGTNRYNGTWQRVMGGDGMLCFIDWNNDQNMWGEQYGGTSGGSLNKSTNGGASWSNASGNINEIGAWVTPWMQDPVASGTIYAGFVNIWKSTNGGTSWTKISAFSNTATVTTFAISPANNQIIWVAKQGGLFLTTNGGTSWSLVANAPAGSITGIACSNTDPNKAWITFSGFTNKNKVFQTNDQGATWINLSASLPNIPVNCITYVDNSNEAVYIGTDAGVFYKDATLNFWQPFFSGLPNVIITQLKIFTPTNKIRASTYGRGMWESDLYVAGSYAPDANFSADKSISCPGSAVQYTDYSAGQPTSWNWTFPGGIPSTSTQQNPVVTYNTPGIYSATLYVNNANGTDSMTYNNYINISTSPNAAPTTTGDVRCGPGVVNLTANPSVPGVVRWWDAAGGGNLLTTGNTYSPNITTTTTFYVDEEFPGGTQDYVGEGDYNFGTGAFFTANDIRGQYFDVLQPLVLNTVDVFPNTAGNRTIEIIDQQGNTYLDTTIYLPASPTNAVTLNLNFTFYPATNYFIKCRGFVDLYRNSGGAVYPYTSSGINITNSNAGTPGYYYFFYNWNYTTFTCNTERVACVALDTCATSVNEIFEEGSFNIYPNPNSGIFTVTFNTLLPDNYKIKVTNAIGQKVYSEELNSFSGNYSEKIDLSKFGKGVYMLQINNSVKQVIKKVTVY